MTHPFLIFDPYKYGWFTPLKCEDVPEQSIGPDIELERLDQWRSIQFAQASNEFSARIEFDRVVNVDAGPTPKRALVLAGGGPGPLEALADRSTNTYFNLLVDRKNKDIFASVSDDHYGILEVDLLWREDQPPDPDRRMFEIVPNYILSVADIGGFDPDDVKHLPYLGSSYRWHYDLDTMTAAVGDYQKKTHEETIYPYTESGRSGGALMSLTSPIYDDFGANDAFAYAVQKHPKLREFLGTIPFWYCRDIGRFVFSRTFVKRLTDAGFLGLYEVEDSLNSNARGTLYHV